MSLELVKHLSALKGQDKSISEIGELAEKSFFDGSQHFH